MKVNVTLEPVFIDIDAMVSFTGLSKSTIQSLVRNGDMPKPRAASDKLSRWLVDEVKEWAAKRPIADRDSNGKQQEGATNE